MSPDNDRSGFVLITVVWLAGLLALVAAAFAGSVRHQTEAAASALAIARAEAIATGALLYVSYRLQTLAAAPQEAWNGVSMLCTLPGGETIVATLQDQAGLVDLNLAEPPLLEALLAGAGLEGEHARRLAEAVVDYRDGDEINAAGHPESEVHAGTGGAGALKNSPFDTIYELDRVPGMQPAILDRLLPWVTVYSPQGSIDHEAAPPALIAALSRAAPRLLGDERFVNVSPRTSVAVEIALPSRPGQSLRAIVLLEGSAPRILLLEPVRRLAPVAARRSLC